MNYSKIISYIYTIIAIILGTYFSINYIYYYIININIYYNKQFIKTIAIIKNINCNNRKKCYADIEYTINNIKYINNIEISNNFKIGDKINIKYNSKAEKNIYYYNNDYIFNLFIYLILLIIFIILLWIFFIIVIISSNKYIFLIYAIIATIIISYKYFNIIYIYYNNYKTEDLYDDYKYYTIGIIKSNNKCKNNKRCISNIEYSIDNIKYNINILTIDYKVGENVKIYYNKNKSEDIKIYDKTKYKRKIILIILILLLILLWFYLLINIPFILKNDFFKLNLN